ncbi:MAG TPA: protein kinase [Pyrinomonadaceae bacterium]
MDQARWQQIEEIFHSARELTPDERNVYLAGVCREDSDLFKEVSSLLRSADGEGSFLGDAGFELGLRLLATSGDLLSSGQEFGNYTIAGFLGRGGMGEVYLAEDIRLGRLVALKVLPTDVASARDRTRRFILEARAASALNHPNILTIHEIGEIDGRRFIASEYVKGITLRELLKDKLPLETSRTIEIGVQISAALTAAHAAGIIHRDIKPENVMLREDGLVKVLDFGLAKLTENAQGASSPEHLTTTGPGLVMGTVAYMSPEQARGQSTDARSDIWSLGVVLYEMLAGHLPFQGETASDIIAAILMTEPSPGQIDDKPGGLWEVVKKALRKDPKERYRSAREMADGLRPHASAAVAAAPNSLGRATDYKRIEDTDPHDVSTIEAPPPGSSDTVGRRSSWGRPALILAAILAIMIPISYAIFSFARNSGWFAHESMKVSRLLDTGKTAVAAISPDGKYVAYAIDDSGKQSLWIKHIATNSTVQLLPPEKVSIFSITFSGDGGLIYYVKNDDLFQIPVLGGEPRKLLSRVGGPVSLSPDASRVAFIRDLTETENALILADIDGGGEVELVRRRFPDQFRGTVAWSPDGSTIAAPVAFKTQTQRVKIILLPVDGGQETSIASEKFVEIDQVVWLPDGSGLLGPADAEDEKLSQIWFFPSSGGDARRITSDLNQYAGASLASQASQLLTLQWQNRYNIWLLPGGKTDEARMLTNNIYAQYRFITVAPDGRVIFPSNENAGQNRDIWIMGQDGSNAKQLTTNSGGNITPCVTGDGRYIVFASSRGGDETYHIWRMDIDGSHPTQLTKGRAERGPHCSPDGQTVVFQSGGPNEEMDVSTLWSVSIDGGEPVQLTNYPSSTADISPDGKSIAFRYKETPDSQMKLGIISIAGGRPIKSFDLRANPRLRWSPDGQLVTYIKNNDGVSNVWAQPVNGDPPRPLTKFTSEMIVGFDWTRNNELICVRGHEARDPVLISNF